MADQTEKPKLGTRPPLGLKRTVETGKVKQSFSHGRSNTVVVEVKKTDGYAIASKTLIGYGNDLISEKRVASWDHALGLYIVGRSDASLA